MPIRRGPTRRVVIAGAAGSVALIRSAGPGPARAAETDTPPWRHGLALLGEPKYPPGFPHFDYVRPDAPKGGVVRFGASGRT